MVLHDFISAWEIHGGGGEFLSSAEFESKNMIWREGNKDTS